VRLRVRSLSMSVWGRGWGDSSSLCRALVADLRVIGEMREIEVLSVFFLFFYGGGSVCGGMCGAHAHTHTHFTWGTRM